MDERKAFIAAYERGEVSFSSLCRTFNISRPTGYKWLDRYRSSGEPGLNDHSRAPIHPARGTPHHIQDAILELRNKHPHWGPKKLAPRRRTPSWTEPLAHAQEPNDVWCTDFKGWFLCRNGERCDPLTLTDAYSRYLLRCHAVAKTDGPHVRRVFEACFREFGLPLAIRSDNGPPFASTGLAGLSRLSVWWIRLGIRPERIDPGCPQQNGRHERFHQTLKLETASPPSICLSAQQRAFIRFQRQFNEERPHEALGQHTPASIYRSSPRPFPLRLPDLVYPFAVTLRSISAAGHFSWRSQQIYVSVLLEGQDVALRPLDDGLHEVFFGPLLLGWFEEESAAFTPNRPPPRRQRKPT